MALRHSCQGIGLTVMIEQHIELPSAFKKYNVCVRSLMLTCTRVMHYSTLNFTFIWLLDLIFLAKFLDNLRFFFIAKNYLFQINNSYVLTS